METILIADDHEIVRRGVRMIIENFPQKYNFVEASSCEAVMNVLASQQVHYAVLDMNLTDGNLFAAFQQITEHNPQISILVYSMNAERIYARRLIEKGARGFLSKQASIAELEIAIRNVLQGEIYLSPDLKKVLFRTGKTALLENPIDLLSDRELEVAEYVAVGMGSKEIAHKMNLDITTVSTYRRRAFEKLDVQNMIELKDKFLLYKYDVDGAD